MSPLSSHSHRETTQQNDAHTRAEELLTRAETCEDEATRRRLQQEAVLLCVDLADAVAHRYRDRGIDVEDLVQVARMGLVKAAGRFRAGVGESFAAYAVPTISGEVKRHFRDSGWMVRPPRRLQERGAALVAAENQLQQELGRSPSRAELADSLGASTDEVAAAQQSQSAFSLLSLDAPTPQETPVHDSVPTPGDPYAVVDRRDALHHALEGLDDRQRTILRLRFVEDWTQSRIGEELGVTQMQISRLLSSILGRLHTELEEAEHAPPDPPTPEDREVAGRSHAHRPDARRVAAQPRRQVRWGYRLSTQSPADRILANARLAEKAGFDELLLADRPLDGDSGDRAFVWSVLGALASATHLPVTVSLDLSRTPLDVDSLARAVRTTRVLLPSGLVVALDLGQAAEQEQGTDLLDQPAAELINRLRGELDQRASHTHGRSSPTRRRPSPGVHMVVRGPRSLALACRYADGICAPGATPGQVETFRRSRGARAVAAAELTVAWDTDPQPDDSAGGDRGSGGETRTDGPGTNGGAQGPSGRDRGPRADWGSRVLVHDPHESVDRVHRLEQTGVDVIHVGTVASHAPDLIRVYGEDIIRHKH